jgi:hypothetical protein
LQQRGDADAVRRIIEQRVSEAPKCPRCGVLDGVLAKNDVLFCQRSG